MVVGPTCPPLSMLDRRAGQFNAADFRIAVLIVLLEHPPKFLHPIAGQLQVVVQQKVVQLPVYVKRFRQVDSAQICQTAPG